MSGKYALIIGNTEYADAGLAQLTAPGKDAQDFARVLKDKDICAFDDVKVVLNQPEHIVRRAIEVFFDQRNRDDLIVLYFSGHGIRDEFGSLYLAVKNTVRSRLRSTAIKSDYVREIMDQSRSKRQILILDCCNSGAFEYGTKAATGVSIGIASAFEVGYGRIILTASDATQFAWEGDQVIGEGITDNSLFTHYLVEGLEGEADWDGDGRITVDELYDYAYEKVKLATPKQTPSKFSSKQQGEIVLRQNTRLEDIRTVSLSADLIDEIEDTRPYVREAAVQKLEKILRGKNIGLTRSAIEALEKIIADENSTRRVAQSATRVLEAFLETGQTTEKMTIEQIGHEREEGTAANMQTDENQLEQPTIEDASNIREGAPLEHRLPVVTAPQTIEQKPTEQQVQLFSTPKLTSIAISIIVVFFLCLGGWMAWRVIFPQMASEPSETSPTRTVISAVPPAIAITFTKFSGATATPAEVIPTLTTTITLTHFPTILPAQDFSPLSFCYKNELDINNQCKVSRTTFVSPVGEVCASWTPSQQYLGSSFRRVWRNDSTGESHPNENSNTYGCLYSTPSLSLGQYEVELYVNNSLIQKGGFVITSVSRVPRMLQILERQENSENGLIIYKDIYFVDEDGDAFVVAYALISTTLDRNEIIIKNDLITSNPDEQKKGTVVTGAWYCGYKYSNYWIILEARILDIAGNQSEPFVLEFNCK